MELRGHAYKYLGTKLCCDACLCMLYMFSVKVNDMWPHIKTLMSLCLAGMRGLDMYHTTLCYVRSLIIFMICGYMIPYQYQYQYQYDIRYQQHQDLGLWSIDTISVRNHNPISCINFRRTIWLVPPVLILGWWANIYASACHRERSSPTRLDTRIPLSLLTHDKFSKDSDD